MFYQFASFFKISNKESKIITESLPVAGLHTPGVQTALVQLAPPFSGIITGLSFFVVAWFGIGNKILTKHMVKNGVAKEWAMVSIFCKICTARIIIKIHYQEMKQT